MKKYSNYLVHSSDTRANGIVQPRQKVFKLSVLLLLVVVLPLGAILAACAKDKPSVDGVTVTKASFEMTVGQSAQFEARVTSDNEDDRGKVSWSSNDGDILVINENTGLAEAKGVGNVQVTVKSTVDNRAFSTISVRVFKSADQEFLDKWHSLIHYDAGKLQSLSVAELVKFYNDMSTAIENLNSIVDKIDSDKVMDFLQSLSNFFGLLESATELIDQSINSKFDILFGFLEHIGTALNKIYKNIDLALAIDGITQGMIDSWSADALEIDVSMKSAIDLIANLQNASDNGVVEELIIKLAHQELEQHSEDIDFLNQFLDWIEPSLDNYQYFANTFAATTRLGRAQWHWWGWRIFIGRHETNKVINALEFGAVDVVVNVVGAISVIGGVLVAVVLAYKYFLLQAFKNNNGSNGVKIDINWLNLSVLATPVGIAWLCANIKRA